MSLFNINAICQTALSVSHEGKVSCSRKQWEPLMGFELMPDQKQLRHTNHCTKMTLSVSYDV